MSTTGGHVGAPRPWARSAGGRRAGEPGAGEPGAGERGQVSAFVTVMTMAVIFVVGLVLDGGRMLTAHRHAVNVADAAARAGAQLLDLDELRASGVRRLAEAAAEAAAEDFAREVGPAGLTVEADAAADRVTVTVAFDEDLLILPGGARGVRATATARLADGP